MTNETIIKELRKALNIKSDAQLAKKINKSRKSIWDFKCGNTNANKELYLIIVELASKQQHISYSVSYPKNKDTITLNKVKELLCT